MLRGEGGGQLPVAVGAARASPRGAASSPRADRRPAEARRRAGRRRRSPGAGGGRRRATRAAASAGPSAPATATASGGARAQRAPQAGVRPRRSVLRRRRASLGAAAARPRRPVAVAGVELEPVQGGGDVAAEHASRRARPGPARASGRRELDGAPRSARRGARSPGAAARRGRGASARSSASGCGSRSSSRSSEPSRPPLTVSSVAAAGERVRVRIGLEPEPGGVAGHAQQPGGVVLERGVVEHAQAARAQVLRAPG